MKSLRDLPSEMQGPGVRAIADLALQIPDAIDLSVGQPDFETPPHIVEAACEAARAGYTKYTPFPGFTSLREKLVDKLQRVNGIAARMEDITVTPGGTFGLAVSAMSVTAPHEEILVPTPGYPTFAQIVALHGGVPRYYTLDQQNNFIVDLKNLEQQITDRTRAIIVNSPANPTGGVFPAETMAAVVALAAEHDLYVISDEVYEAIIFEGKHVSPAVFDEDGRVITVFSFSKTYAMTGWRIGYVAAPPSVSGVIQKLLEPYTGAASSVSQKAAEAALDGDQACVEEMRIAYLRRRDVALKLLDEYGLRGSTPRGAFYFFVDISPTGLDAFSFAEKLLKTEGVAVRPGDIFGIGGKGFVRVSFAASEEDVAEGIKRLGRFVQQHR